MGKSFGLHPGYTFGRHCTALTAIENRYFQLDN